ncbi:glutathione S-transferase T1 isoform X2 [Lactuca sativa]|uniref:glutathione transferase n=2 Tax=Lactuca sativa TaxID=4236 RepID=A0A9R1VBY2_LACSA|nr:glutathione S-transferase T1 isoform X2 [Lactuca sativa]KAJ0201941.1 hypothetical protein LSAT_V11C600301410 [Lactuca sativa]
MVLKVYGHRISEPSRAVLIFCKINMIDFEEIHVEVLKGQQFSQEYGAITPIRQIPAIVDGHLKLIESHAILIYLSCSFPGVASHWYPGDPQKRAKIHSILDWHHSHLRRGAAGLVYTTILAPLNGLRSFLQIVIQAEEILLKSLSELENVWLKDGTFLGGISQPSIADLSLACEVMQLELLNEEDYHQILSPYKKVKKWIKDVRSATAPYFDEIHEYLFESQKGIRDQMATQSGKKKVRPKM